MPGPASPSLLIGALKHEDGVVDLEGRTQLDAQDLHDVGLCEKQESLSVNLLQRQEDRGLSTPAAASGRWTKESQAGTVSG